MTFDEVNGNVFNYAKTHVLAHCIASDLCMGAGIAVPMKKKFGLSGLRQLSKEELKHPTCVYYNGVLNLITKKNSTGKPNYSTMADALRVMRKIVTREKIAKIAMPRIGCGLDRLEWPLVRDLIQCLFKDIDVSIVVVKLVGKGG